jgi:hypothetical protein
VAALRENRPESRCAARSGDTADLAGADRYASLPGQHLGDDHLVTSARVPALRVCCAANYPGILDECRRAMLTVLARPVSVGCVAVQSSTHWPCLFPQHGPGMETSAASRWPVGTRWSSTRVPARSRAA